MDPSHDYQASAEMRGIPGLADMYLDRKERGSEFDARRKELMTSLEKIDGYEEKIWYEPGLWVVPRDPATRSRVIPSSVFRSPPSWTWSMTSGALGPSRQRVVPITPS
ncbi:hypothetical protein ON010_g18434 [Phytophthora cinnamomi]|nr:hypothetical protein ON010_g18434 [Phytophthora cinnamomi]